MSISISRRSRLNFGELIQDGSLEYWDMLELPALPEQTDDLQYKVQSGDRIFGIASRMYGNPAYWWVIAVANNLEILPTQLNEGAVIRIPSPRYVNQELFKGLK